VDESWILILAQASRSFRSTLRSEGQRDRISRRTLLLTAVEAAVVEVTLVAATLAEAA